MAKGLYTQKLSTKAAQPNKYKKIAKKEMHMKENAKLREYIMSLSLSGEELTDDLDLLKSGFLNSINFIKLVTYLQKEHQVAGQTIFSILEESLTIKKIFNVIEK